MSAVSPLYSRPALEFKFHTLDPAARLDAICYIADGVWLVGARRQVSSTVGAAGRIWKTTDGGATWTLKQTLTGQPNINAMFHAGGGLVYALTGAGELWKSEDAGETWAFMSVVTTSSPSFGTRAYGLCLTPLGTILVSDTRNAGGKVFRSTDGGLTFSDRGAVSTKELYRFMVVGDGILVNGWSGSIYKSTDDGLSWVKKQTVSSSPLYAIEYLGDGIVLVADEVGAMYRSVNNGDSFTLVGAYDGGSDDACHIGDGRIVYVTYTARRRIYVSDNWGKVWRVAGGAFLLDKDDNIDRMAHGKLNGETVIVGSTIKGRIVRMRMN